MHPIKSICRRGWAKHSVLQLSVSIGFFRPNALPLQRGWAKHSVLQLSVSIGFFRPNALPLQRGWAKHSVLQLFVSLRFFRPNALPLQRGWAKHSVSQLSVSIGFFRPNASTKGLGKAFGVTVICFHRIFSPECFYKGAGRSIRCHSYLFPSDFFARMLRPYKDSLFSPTFFSQKPGFLI